MSSTSITYEELRLLKKFTDKIVWMVDGIDEKPVTEEDREFNKAIEILKRITANVYGANDVGQVHSRASEESVAERKDVQLK